MLINFDYLFNKDDVDFNDSDPQLNSISFTVQDIRTDAPDRFDLLRNAVLFPLKNQTVGLSEKIIDKIMVNIKVERIVKDKILNQEVKLYFDKTYKLIDIQNDKYLLKELFE
ncbi:hypothetical protein [Oenococcus oeni]|uniref:hypothetical protein n=1 Tax=Oenococcus oeni TaxID=1247 RepID=UPI0008F97650|nr:hypothetical protein [Oenococcus oeni]OIM27020.1 hypothetical protein ATX61_03500 [Oenococcus oeni]SYW10349.1 conserved hypothetical protein [Oenococcus oeni]SYW16343.1 conserved hypothetical protein [Oenococcus oeni]